jgi:hypothetical protein
MNRIYEIFSGEELKIAEKIQRRRYQMLVHSYIYYEMNENIISDNQWSQWAVELAQLQSKYPNIAKQVIYAEDFEGWDGSSGAFLSYTNKPNIPISAHFLLKNMQKAKTPLISTPAQPKPLINKTSSTKKKLF